MFTFIGRKKEINFCIEQLKQPVKTLTVLLGMRGVGKSTFFNYFCHFTNQQSDIYLTLNFKGVRNLSDKNQRTLFINNFNKQIGTDILNTSTKNWFEIFDEINLFLSSEKKKVIFLFDKLPWFQNKKSDFIQAFGYFYDSIQSSAPAIFLTGSNVSWIQNKVINDKGGFYHKAKVIELQPFTLPELIDFSVQNKLNLSQDELIIYSMITNGIPRHITKINSNLSIDENFKFIFSKQNEYASSELNSIIDDMFLSNPNYFKVIKLFGLKNEWTAKEIQKKLQISIGLTHKIIQELIFSGIIYTTERLDKSGNSNRFFRLKNLFIYYHLKQSKSEHEHFELSENNIVNGFAFETWCYNNITFIKKELKLDLPASLYRLNLKENQYDLILKQYYVANAQTSCFDYTSNI